MPEQDDDLERQPQQEEPPVDGLDQNGMAAPAAAAVADAAMQEVNDDPFTLVMRERDEYLDALRRLQAEFENYRKRMVREQTMHLERATEGLVEQLLPVLDAFQLALLNSGGDAEKLQKGVEIVYAELLGVLERTGLERIEAEGKPFDPTVHEAVMSVDGDGGDPVVVEEMRSGWRLKGRLLRPAMVKVSMRRQPKSNEPLAK
jgi:molecular chaperone GrpE